MTDMKPFEGLIDQMISTKVKPKRIRCSEIWGGIRNSDLDVSTSAVSASLYAGASDGVRGGDIYYFSVCEEDTITRIALADVRSHGNDVSEMSQWMYHALATRMNTADSSGILADLNSVAGESGYKAFTTAVVLSFRGGQLQAVLLGRRAPSGVGPTAQRRGVAGARARGSRRED